MASLPTPVILRIVQGLACFDTPTEVAKAVNEEFGLELSRQRIEAWNPERAAGARLKAHWRETFYATRKRLLAELDEIPLFHRSYRLRCLQRLLEQAEAISNISVANKAMEQAAKEVGGWYER
jgi:hypothetical protein